MAFDRAEVVPVPARNWQDGAACNQAGTKHFFNEDERRSYKVMGWREFCPGCPVRADCLAFAILGDEQWGVWGGFTPNQRRALLSHLLEETVAWRQVIAAFPKS